jgi:hypothetical protein
LSERTELVSGEMCVTIFIAVRGIQHEKMIYRQRKSLIDRGGRPVRRGEYEERHENKR